MHELLLHASIPCSRHEQVLSILAGVAAMQPVSILERHLIFKPTRPPHTAGKGNTSQNTQAGQMKALLGQMHGDLFYLKLVEDVKEKRDAINGEQANGSNGVRENGDVVMGEDGPSASQVEANGGVHEDAVPSTSWMLQFRDLPDSNKGRPVTSRAMADIPIMSGDPMKFMAALDYVHTSTLLLQGHRLTHSSINLQLLRPLSLPASAPADTNSSAITLSSQNLLESATPIDPAGSYILQTSVRVEDGQKLDRMQQATTELLNLKEILKGAMNLEMADRLSMDTRVR